MCMPFLTDKGIEVNIDALWESGGSGVRLAIHSLFQENCAAQSAAFCLSWQSWVEILAKKYLLRSRSN